MPFHYLEVHEARQLLCCGTWLDDAEHKHIGFKDNNYKENFYGPRAEEIRKSVTDGSFRYCNIDQCPHLAALKRGKLEAPLHPRNSGTIKWLNESKAIRRVNFMFDRSCNLACPTCRVDFINEKGERRVALDAKFDKLSEDIKNEVEMFDMSGSADPFFSNSYRKFLINLDLKQFPKLKHIHFQTNAVLWTPQFWAKLKHLHHLNITAGISIDAATEDTYKIVRVGGNWDKLMENLTSIVRYKSLKSWEFSMVVQDDNYKEMFDFYEMIRKLFIKYRPDIGEQEENGDVHWTVFYNVLADWGTFSKDKLKEKQVHKPDNPLYQDFLKEVDRLPKAKNIKRNF